MSDPMTKLIDNVRADRENCELRASEKWRAHIEDHRIEKSQSINSKQFVYGVIFLSVLDIGVAVLLHFIS